MTSKEKASELVDKFRKASRHKYLERTGDDAHEAGKKLALICIDEIIEVCESDESAIIVQLQYWQAVKTEIEKL